MAGRLDSPDTRFDPTSKERATFGAPEPGIAWLIWEAFNHTRRVIDEVVRSHGVTSAQLGLLNRLDAHPGSSGADLARRMLITSQAAQLALATLERKALVERKPHPSGRRQSQCFLTEDGRRVVESCRAEMGDVEKRLVAPLTPAQRDELATLLSVYLQK